MDDIAKNKSIAKKTTIDPRMHVYEVYIRTIKQLQDRQVAKQKREHIARVETEASGDVNILLYERELLQDQLKEVGDKYEKINDLQGAHQQQLKSIMFSETTKNQDPETTLMQEKFYRKVLLPALADEMDLRPITIDKAADTATSRILPYTSLFLIWRITEDGMEYLSKDTFSGLYDRECFIFYVCVETNTFASIDLRPHKMRRKSMEINLHIWVGNQTTRALTSYAAVKVFEINKYIKNAANIHRETQGYETTRFRSYFPNGLRIFTGYFRCAESVFINRPALYQLRGRARPVMVEKETISWSHFNSDEVFLILTEYYIFIWFGSRASSIEKLNAIKVAENVEKETDVSSLYFVDDGCEEAISAMERESFEKALRLKDRKFEPYKNLNECIADQIHKLTIRLYLCTPVKDMANYKLTEAAQPGFSSTILRKQHVYLLDHCPYHIWVWCGSNLANEEKSDSLRNARGFIKKKQLHNGTPISIICEGKEPPEFKFLFTEWVRQEHGSRRPNLSANEVTLISSDLLLERSSLAAELQLIDSGHERFIKYRVTKEEGLTELTVKAPRDHYVFTEDCYIIIYFYKKGSEERIIIYYWFGGESSVEDRDETERIVEEKDREFSNTAMVVKMFQGTEPPHFLQVCQGLFTVYQGSGNDFDETGFNRVQPSKYLLKINGSTSFTGHGVQIPMTATSLNSNYLFKLKRRTYYLWCGRFTSGDQRELAKEYLPHDYVMVYEGNEPTEFWEEIGGKKNYRGMHKVIINNEIIPPALYLAYNLNGTTICESSDFRDQSVFTPHSILLLDYFKVLYIWIGSKISPQDLEFVKTLPKDYLEGDIKLRSIETVSVAIIKQGYEPVLFRGFFDGWILNFFDYVESYTSVRDHMELASPLLMNCRYADPSNVHIMKAFQKYPKNTIEELTCPPEELPTYINFEHKECHLTVDDFFSTFGMHYHEFYKLPKWKQDALKRQKGLF